MENEKITEKITDSNIHKKSTQFSKAFNFLKDTKLIVPINYHNQMEHCYTGVNYYSGIEINFLYIPKEYSDKNRIIGYIRNYNNRISSHSCDDSFSNSNKKLVDVSLNYWRDMERLVYLIGVNPNLFCEGVEYFTKLSVFSKNLVEMSKKIDLPIKDKINTLDIGINSSSPIILTKYSDGQTWINGKIFDASSQCRPVNRGIFWPENLSVSNKPEYIKNHFGIDLKEFPSRIKKIPYLEYLQTLKEFDHLEIRPSCEWYYGRSPDFKISHLEKLGDAIRRVNFSRIWK